MTDHKLFYEKMSKTDNALQVGKIDVILCERLDKKAFETRRKENNSDCGHLIYLLNGTMECECADGRSKEVRSNESMLIPRGMPHCIREAGSDDFSAILVRFRINSLEFSRCIHVCDRNLRILCILNILNDELKGEHSTEMLKHFLFGSVLLMMLEMQFETETKTSTFDKAIRYLHSHLNEKINVKELARILFVSPSYLCRVFQKRAHMTVMDCLCNMRINEARQYLEDTNYGIEEIAFKVGFSSPKYFTKKFKEDVGMTPSSYRKSKSNN